MIDGTQWSQEYDRVIARQPRADKRWVLDVAGALARVALDEWRSLLGHASQDQAPPELAEAAESRMPHVSWEALSKHIREPIKNDGDSLASLSLTAALLCAAAGGGVRLASGTEVRFGAAMQAVARTMLDNDLVTTTLPAISRPRRSGRHQTTTPDHLMVECLGEAEDHRALIVGQLPKAGLHPIVFVNPGNLAGQWFTQEEPIVADRAFATMVYFGNPGLIGYDGDAPPRYHVKVLALDKPWQPPGDDRRASIDNAELQKLVKRAGPFEWPKEGVDDSRAGHVQRASPRITRLTISQDDDRGVQVMVPPRFPCSLPVTLNWEGTGDVYVEVRAVEGDVFQDRKRAGRGTVTLARPGKLLATRAAPLSPVIELRDPGPSYRVKFYPAKEHLVLDPLLEVWLDVDDTA